MASVTNLYSSFEHSRRQVNSGGSGETELRGGPRLKVVVLVVCLWDYILMLLARWMLCPWFVFQLNGAVGTGGKMLGRQEMGL